MAEVAASLGSLTVVVDADANGDWITRQDKHGRDARTAILGETPNLREFMTLVSCVQGGQQRV